MYSICTGCWVTATLTCSVSNGVVILGSGVSGGRLIGSSEPAKRPGSCSDPGAEVLFKVTGTYTQTQVYINVKTESNSTSKPIFP